MIKNGLFALDIFSFSVGKQKSLKPESVVAQDRGEGGAGKKRKENCFIYH